MSTVYHAKYWANELERQGAAGTIDSIGKSMSNSRIKLNPYQVDAAIFALNSPMRQGVLPADEVGLGAPALKNFIGKIKQGIHETHVANGGRVNG